MQSSQKYPIEVKGGRAPKDTTIIAPNGSFSLGETLGKGGYGTVHTLKKRKHAEIDASVECISYSSSQAINANYVIKLPFDSCPADINITQEQQTQLGWITTATPFHHPYLGLTDNSLLTAIGNETLHQMEVEQVLKNLIDTYAVIDNFSAQKQRERTIMLEELKREASYVTRYYMGTDNNATVLESEPYTTVTFHCHDYAASLNYYPAIAMLMPHVPGIRLHDYPKHHFNHTVTFSHLLALFTHISNAFSNLHVLNILHLDASTANIMIDPSNQHITFIDFGKAIDLINTDGTPSTTLQIQSKTKNRYWRAHRVCPENVEPLTITVGAEDDVFSLVKGLEYLTVCYDPSATKKHNLTGVFFTCIQQIIALLEKPDACLDNALSLISTIISLMQKLNKLESLSTKTTNDDEKAHAIADFNAASLYIREISPTLEQNGTFVQKAQSIFQKAAPMIESFKQSPAAVTQNYYPGTPRPNTFSFAQAPGYCPPNVFREHAHNLPGTTM